MTEKIIWADDGQERRVLDPYSPFARYITLKPRPRAPRDPYGVTVPEDHGLPAGVEVVTLQNGRRRAVIVEEGPDE